jgi:MFS family permease
MEIAWLDGGSTLDLGATEGEEMKRKADSHLTSDDRGLRIVWDEVIKSWDFAGALVVFPVALAVSLDNISIRDSGEAFLIAVAALGVAFTGVVGGILAILTTWFDESYRKVLQKAGGWRGAMRPYAITAILGLITVMVAIGSLFIWSIANPQLRSTLLALTLSLFVWTLIGSIQIIRITFFHGEMRSELLRGMEEARRALARRRKEKRVS